MYLDRKCSCLKSLLSPEGLLQSPDFALQFADGKISETVMDTVSDMSLLLVCGPCKEDSAKNRSALNRPVLRLLSCRA